MSEPSPTVPSEVEQLAMLQVQTTKQISEELAALKAEFEHEKQAKPRNILKRAASGLWTGVKAVPAKLASLSPLSVAKVAWGTWVTLALIGAGSLATLTIPSCDGLKPGPGPSPLPGDGNRFMVAYDRGTKMTQDHLSAIYADEVWRYINANAATGPEGAKEARIFDDQNSSADEHPIWQEGLKRSQGKKLPFLLVAGTKSSYEGDVPTGADAKAQMVAILKKCYGDHKLPAKMQASIDAYELKDDDFEPKGRKTGLIPRDFKAKPQGFYAVAPPFDIPTMTDEEIEAAITRKNADQSWPDDIRNRGKNGDRIPSRDQDGKGYCWAHSSVSSTLLVRAMNNQPYADLSAYAVACIIKNYRDEGGWGAESLQFIADKGVPSSQFWAQQSMSRANDNPKTWTNAKLHRVTEWMELEPRNKRQLATCLCQNIPVVVDYNWWSHSVCACRLISWGPNGSNLKIRIWNSWGDGWSQNGMGDLSGSKAIPDGAVAPRVVNAAFARAKQVPGESWAVSKHALTPLFNLAP